MLRIKTIILFLGDIIILYFSLWLTLVLRHQRVVTSELWYKHLLPFSIIFIVWLIIFFINRLYDLTNAKTNLHFYSVWLNSLVWCGLIGFVFFYLITTGINPKTVLIIDLFVGGILLLLWRQLFNKIILAKKFVENIIIIGLSKNTLDLAEEINNKLQYGFKVIAIMKLPKNNTNLTDEQIKILDSNDNLKDFIINNNIKKIIIDEKVRDYPEMINTLYKSLTLKTAIFDLPSFAEKFTGKILIDTIGQMWFLENIKENNKYIYEIMKRLMDIGLSGLLLIITLPIMPAVYLIIRFTSKGPGIFMQQRTGQHGKKFMAVKFRTMYQNSETNGPQWAQKNDSRITPIGKFLRKTRIDEIPQLINVFRGEMSFIGPRPERPEFITKLKETIPFYEARLLIKPGITGWAQINFPYGASEKDAMEKLQYDLYYVKNRSLALDISILLKTVKTVLSGGGQ